MMRMLRWSLGLAMLAGVLLVGGCRSTEPLPVVGTIWILDTDTLAGRDVKWELPRKPVTLCFESQLRAFGSAGVNDYNGPVSLDMADRTLKFEHPRVTLMAGPGMEYEAYYLKLLAEKVDHFNFRDGRLQLLNNDTLLMEFTPSKAPEAK